MSCQHDRLRTVGDQVFCCECGEELTVDFLEGKNKPTAAQKRAKNEPEESGQVKTQARKRAAKKAE